MKTLLRRAAATAAATVIGVSLLVAAKSGPGGTPAALRQPGVIGRPPEGPAPKLPVATAPPVPETTSSTAPVTSTTAAPPTTAAPAPSTTATTATTLRPSTSSTTATTRPAPTTAPTTRPTPVTRPAPATAPPAPVPAQPTAPPTAPAPATTTTAPTTTTTTPSTVTVDSPAFTASYGYETYGQVQVRLTIQGHRIVDAVALQTPNSHAKSVQINSRAVPILRQEVLAAQSAQIDTVSGATATSQAYAQAVQAILDQVWK